MTLELLQQAYLNLRAMFHALLIIVLVLSGSLDVFLLRQVSLVRKEVEDRQSFVEKYEKTEAPVMGNFVARLREFTRSNPDFAPILAKYSIPTEAPLPTAPTARPPK